MRAKLIIWDKEGYEKLPGKMKNHIIMLCKVIPQLYPDIETAVLVEATGERIAKGRFQLIFVSSKRFVELELYMETWYGHRYPRYDMDVWEYQKEFQFPSSLMFYSMGRHWELGRIIAFADLVDKMKTELRTTRKEPVNIRWRTDITLPWASLVPPLFYDEDMVKAILIQMILH